MPRCGPAIWVWSEAGVRHPVPLRFSQRPRDHFGFLKYPGGGRQAGGSAPIYHHDFCAGQANSFTYGGVTDAALSSIFDEMKPDLQSYPD